MSFPCGSVNLLIDKASCLKRRTLNPSFSPFSRLLATYEPRAKTTSAIDLGCGSGVQGIALAKKGVGTVHCVDISLDCIELTHLHSSLNGVSDQIEAYQADVFSGNLPMKYDLIICNPPTISSVETPPLWANASLSSAASEDDRNNPRFFLDRLISLAPSILNEGGELVFVQPSFVDIGASLFLLTQQSLSPTILDVIQVEATHESDSVRFHDHHELIFMVEARQEATVRKRQTISPNS